MKKITNSNSFDGGLITDLSVFNTPNNAVSDSLNMELITTHNDQYLMQNVRGNEKIVDLGIYSENGVDYKYIPLGLKVYNDIAYIIAGAFTDAGEFMTGTIGTFPSPDWDYLNADNSNISKLEQKFRSLHNFHAVPDPVGFYESPFVSKEFNLTKNRYIDIIVQGEFDRSANIIFTDNKNYTRIINSRFKTVDQYGSYKLADRRGDKDSNIYSDDDWDRISLVQSNDSTVTVSDAIITNEGNLFGGGYKYFFKYVTQEGNTTDVIYESPLIPIANGGLGLKGSQTSNKQVEFSLAGLDSSYQGVKVFFAHFDGYPKAGVKYFKINYTYRYDGTTLTIKHNGLEGIEEIKQAEINVSFSPVDTTKSIDIINDRLALANITSTMLEKDLKIMEEAAQTITLWEHNITTDKSYSDADLAANKLGYWKGEVYEFAVIFTLKNKGLSPAFPTMGMDNIDGVQIDASNPDSQYFSNREYPPSNIGTEGFDTTKYLLNNKGLFRTSFAGKLYTPECGKEGKRHITYINFNTSKLKDNAALNGIVTGFFIVRRERVKNILMQGMMVPTLRLPATKMSSCPQENGGNREFIGNYRHTSYYYPYEPTLGLNTKYQPTTDSGTTPLLSTDFPTVFVPQPTQVLNVLTFEKAWALQGGIGQTIADRDEYGKYVDFDGNEEEKEYMSFYSSEIDLGGTAIVDKLTGSSPSIEIQKLRNNFSPTGFAEVGILTDLSIVTELKEVANQPANFVVKGIEPVDIDRAPFIKIHADEIVTTYIKSGAYITAKDSFTGKVDRVYGYHASKSKDGINPPIRDFNRNSSSSLSTYINYTIRICGSCNGVEFNPKADNKFTPYSLISQSYSSYLGIKVDTSKLTEDIKFNYADIALTSQTFNNHPNKDIATECGDSTSKFLNIGHLTNVFASGKGRWEEADILNIYKFDSNKPYFTSTKRYKMHVTDVDVFSGDAFISKFYKRVTYKNGVGVDAATAGDAGVFKVGLSTLELKGATIIDAYKDDKGRNLFDVGQIIEIVTQTNINADIRSTEFVSENDSKHAGYDRDFYPHRESMFSDKRPDSIMYNDGYSPTNHVIPYFRISENASVLNTQFPNRILLSEKNQVQEFYNSFRDLRGFNYRDYGVEYGPIQKILSISGAILSVHDKGILLVGVDDRTLIAEGSDIYIDTAKALSPKAAVISDLYGTSHPESVIKTDTTIVGVDYNSDIVWMFVGNKLQLISEFAVKTLLRKFKNKIVTSDFDNAEPTKTYIPRVYTTFSSVKHTIIITYVAEDPDTHEQHSIGVITFSTSLNKWMSRLSEGNKFLVKIVGDEYSFGFSEVHNIWKENSLIDSATGKYVRSRLRDVNYNTEFEIIINENPTYEKILENIIVLCNKRIPTELVFKTSGDVNDPAVDIWGTSAESTTTRQLIKTRGDSLRKGNRLGILDQNAYYRDSKLLIEVGKVEYSIRSANNKRIRDKHIKVRFIYTGNDELFVQSIISILSLSQN